MNYYLGMSNFLTLSQMQEFVDSDYVIFAKEYCRFCDAAKILFEELKKQAIIDNFVIRVLDVDFDNKTLSLLAQNNGWIPDGGQGYPSKPQIFMKGEYIGGSYEFHKSHWNVGKGMPNLKNPMRF
jgi:glutaredoxin